MKNLTVRDLRRDDIETLQLIDAEAHGKAWSTRVFVDEIDLADRVHLVAVDGRNVVGHAAAWLDANVGRVTNVAVAPAARGSGVAASLLARLLRSATEHAEIDSFALEVRSDNRRAQRFYMRFGFAPVGIERNFYDWGRQRDALTMVVADARVAGWRELLELLERQAA